MSGSPVSQTRKWWTKILSAKYPKSWTAPLHNKTYPKLKYHWEHPHGFYFARTSEIDRWSLLLLHNGNIHTRRGDEWELKARKLFYRNIHLQVTTIQQVCMNSPYSFSTTPVSGLITIMVSSYQTLANTLQIVNGHSKFVLVRLNGLD